MGTFQSIFANSSDLDLTSWHYIQTLSLTGLDLFFGLVLRDRYSFGPVLIVSRQFKEFIFLLPELLPFFLLC